MIAAGRPGSNFIKLGDFGIAKVLEGTLEMAKTVIGSAPLFYSDTSDMSSKVMWSNPTRWPRPSAGPPRI